MRPATCHPDREHHARGLCAPCYRKVRHEEVKAGKNPPRKPCAVCRTIFPPDRWNAKYCSDLCYRVGVGWASSKSRGTKPEGEEVVATRDRAVAAELVRVARSRGCQRIHPMASGKKSGLTAYYSAWYRGEGLYIVRVRWPDGQRIAA